MPRTKGKKKKGPSARIHSRGHKGGHVFWGYRKQQEDVKGGKDKKIFENGKPSSEKEVQKEKIKVKGREAYSSFSGNRKNNEEKGCMGSKTPLSLQANWRRKKDPKKMGEEAREPSASLC